MRRSAMSQTEPAHSGTSVFYQAVPAVGADGKNIMKLIPVQKVNGQFFRSESRPNAAHKVVTVKTAPAPVQTVTKPFVKKKKVPLVDAVPHQEGPDLSPNKQNVQLTAVVPPMATPAASGRKSGGAPSQLPVTANLPGPKSELCPAVKTQILTSSAGSTPGPSSPSPPSPQRDSDLHPLTLFWKTSSKTSRGPPSEGQKQRLILIPKVSQRPNSPIKWFVQGEDSPTDPAPDPAPDPVHTSLTSEVLQAVAERENDRKIVTKPVYRASPENTFVMCNDPKKWVFKEEDNSLAPTPDPVHGCVASEIQRHTSLTSEVLRVVPERENDRNIVRSSLENTFVMCNDPKKWGFEEEDNSLSPTPDPVHGGVASEILRAVAERENDRNVVTKPVYRSSPENTFVMCSSPKKLVFKEKDNSLAPTPDPVHGCVASEILRAVAETEHNRKHRDIVMKPAYPTSRRKIGQGRVNTIDMCNIPRKWVFEEQDSSLAPTPDPVQGCVASEILRAVAEREHDRKHREIVTKPVYRPNPENTFVMCNGPKKWVFKEEDNSLTPTVDQINSTVASEVLRVVAQRENDSKHCDIVTKPVSGNTAVMCNNPKKWVKEDDASAAPAVDPIKPSVTSEVLRVVAQREHANQHHDVVTKPVSKISPAKSGPRQDGARVMSPKKLEKEKEDSPAPVVDPIKPSVTSEILRVVAERENARRFDTTKPFSQVQKNTVVICNGRVILVTRSCTRPHKMAHDDDDDSPEAARKSSESKKNAGFCSEESGDMMDLCGDDEAASVRRSAGTRPDEENVVFVSYVPPKTVSEPTQGLGSRSPSSRTGQEISGWTSRRMDENLLKQKFGISAEVKVFLQRVDERSVGSEPEQSESVRSAKDHQEPTSGLRETEEFLQNRHSDVTPTERFTPDTKRLSVLRNPSRSPRRTSCVDAEPAVAYMEPIDEDFLSTEEKSRSRTHMDQNTNTRRVGRTRKRPACPCCLPGTQHPAAKSRSEPPERWSHSRAGRTKSVKTSGRTSWNRPNVKTQGGPVRDSGPGSPRTSVDSEEVDLHGEIRRLRELLREKETALQLMRSSTSR